MPGGDRTGPLGMGPMTGRAAGYCAGYAVPGFTNALGGRGFGGGGRGGRGRRNRYYATRLTGWQRAAWGWPAFGAGAPYGAPYAGPSTPPAMDTGQEVEGLKRQAEYFADALEAVKKRIEQLEAQPEED